MMFVERTLLFSCKGESLVGVVTDPAATPRSGVLIIVGGPQYRAGSHRQFVLLARQMAENGLACMRFDNRGMGDSMGEARDFEVIDDDIAAAVDAFMDAVPTLEKLVLWGLCGGASAAAAYAPCDSRVSGLVLLNPWVRTEETAARTYLKHYYAQRLLDLSFWKRLVGGQVGVFRAFGGFVSTFRRTRIRSAKSNSPVSGGKQTETVSLYARILKGVGLPGMRTVIILSGRDYVAREFEDVVKASPEFSALISEGSIKMLHFPDVDHTFSNAVARRQLGNATCDWVEALNN
ncbi:MAG: hydrolase 1, exosortase A system-associated [Azoarcus sp.]|nr:hydrolase 1, exosortase A system-associated [Azoarcus sp.]